MHLDLLCFPHSTTVHSAKILVNTSERPHISPFPHTAHLLPTKILLSLGKKWALPTSDIFTLQTSWEKNISSYLRKNNCTEAVWRGSVTRSKMINSSCLYLEIQKLQAIAALLVASTIPSSQAALIPGEMEFAKQTCTARHEPFIGVRSAGHSGVTHSTD